MGVVLCSESVGGLVYRNGPGLERSMVNSGGGVRVGCGGQDSSVCTYAHGVWQYALLC